MSFDESLTTDLDLARFHIGDTSNDSATELLTDDQIEAVLGLYTPLAIGIAVLADGLAIRFAQKPGSVRLPSGLAVSWSDRVKTWLALAKRLRDTGSLSGSSVAFSRGSTRSDGYSEAAAEA